MTDKFFWVCAYDARPAGTRFIIANGQDELWMRAGREILSPRGPAWNHVNILGKPVSLTDILHLLLNTVPLYGVSRNKFVLECAQIPVFASFVNEEGPVA
jgi:hypothetical protein